MSEQARHEASSSPEDRLSEVQRRFVDFVVAKAGVEFTEGTAVTVYGVQDDALIELIAFSQYRDERQYYPHTAVVGYYDFIEDEAIYDISLFTDSEEPPATKKAPFSVLEGGDVSFRLSDALAEEKLTKLEALDAAGRMSVSTQATEDYKRLYLRKR